MSETSDDLERDQKLAALYRAGAHDEPPPALDDAIRAAARRAVASKPRSAGASFSRWRVPLSIAAMVVLSVSLVTLMVEEAPELARPPRADMPGSPAEVERKPAEPAPIPGQSASMIPKTVAPDAQETGRVGLKPPQQAAPPAIGLRSNTGAPAAVAGLRKEAAGREGDSVPSRPTRREPLEAFPGSDESRGHASGGVAGKPERQAAEEESRARDSRFAQAPRAEQVPPPPSTETMPSAPVTPPAAVAELKSASKSESASADNAAREQPRARMQAAPAPAAKRAPSAASAAHAYANLPPEKWLEQIETLRKQGRTDEARASFAEFRRRHPDHPLPDSLKDWVKP